MRRIIGLASMLTIFAAAPVLAAAGPFVVFFSPWSASFDSAADAVIVKAAAAAKADPHANITVTSAADTIGSSQANVYLSELRAQVVADALAAHGVAGTRLHQAALGAKGMPNTAEQFERRALIRLTP